MLNTIQRVGGSLGTAILAVVLQHQIAAQVGTSAGGGEGARTLPPAVRSRVAEPLTRAFSHAYWWAVPVTAVAVIPALVLAVAEHRRAAAGGGARSALRPAAA